MTVGERDRDVQSGENEEEVEIVQAGAVENEEEEVVTATTGEESTDDTGIVAGKEEGLSPEDIMSGEPQKSGAEKFKERTMPSVQKRIDKIAGQKNEAQDKLRKANEKIQQLEAEKLAPRDRPKVPDRDEYVGYDEYQKAYDKYQDDTISYNNAQASITARTRTAETRDQSNADRFVEQAGKLQEKFPDVYDTINRTNYGNARQAIADSPHNARIGLYLAKNQAERVRIGSLGDMGEINREVGKIEARFESAGTMTTNAPKPLEPVGGNGEIVTREPGKMTDEEWYKWRQAEEFKRLKKEK